METHWRTVLFLLTIAAAPISAVDQTGAAYVTLREESV